MNTLNGQMNPTTTLEGELQPTKTLTGRMNAVRVEGGASGENGGYYTPVVSQLNENTMQISFTASKDGMAAVADQTITLPAGKDGEDGKDGSPGNPGKDGEDGESAYDIAVKNGFVGSEQEWSSSIMESVDDISKARTNAVYVLDEASDGDIADILKDYQRKRDTLQIVYIKLDDGDATEGQSWSSDAACIITKHSNIMVDFGRIQDYNRIKTALLENNVTRIDYIFLSHYHHDHCGCMNTNKAGSASAAESAGTSLSTLWADDDIDTSNCVIVLPADAPTSLTSGGEPEWVKRVVMNLVSSRNIPTAVPSVEGGYWKVNDAVIGEMPVWSNSKPKGGVIIRAHNCTSSQLTQYASHGDYNECSTILEVELGYTLATLTGDSSHMAQIALADRLRQTDILKLGHHMTDTDWHQPFYERLNPRYCVASVDEDIYQNYMSSLMVSSDSYFRPAINWLAGKRIPIYPLAVSGTCIFESDGAEFRLISNNRNYQPQAVSGHLLWAGSAAAGAKINMSGTGWRAYNLYAVAHANSGTGLLCQRVTTADGEFFRGIGGSSRTSSPEYPITAQVSCTVSGDEITVVTSSLSSHLQASQYHSINSKPAIVAIYGLC